MMADDSAGFGVIFLRIRLRIWGDELAIFYDPVVLAPKPPALMTGIHASRQVDLA